MNKSDLIETLARKTGDNKVATGEFVDALFETIADALAHGETVQLFGFGAFGVSETKARTGRNPRTGETIQIAAGKRPKFTAGAKLKSAVAKKQVTDEKEV